jgi:hypothetical protein
MKLTYRGVSYEYTPPQVELSNSNTVGKYRGLDVRFRNPKKVSVFQPTLDLIYRGVAHVVNPVSQPTETAAPVAISAEPVAAPVTSLSVSDRARSLMMKHHRIVKQRQQAMLSRLDAEIGLVNGDARHWNHIQGKIHPSFWDTYDRSHTALS